MSSEVDCKYCKKPLKWNQYVRHLIQKCKALSADEKKRAEEANTNLICQCLDCGYYFPVNKYAAHCKVHSRDEFIIDRYTGALLCACPCHTAVVRFKVEEYRNHISDICQEYIRFIAFCCRPPADFPAIPELRFESWLSRRRELYRDEKRGVTRKPSNKEPRVVEPERGESIYKPFQGGLMKGK